MKEKNDTKSNKDNVINDEINLVTLEDSNGDEIIFEVIYTLTYNEKDYIVLLPLPEYGDADEYTILRFKADENGEVEEFFGIDDYNELTAVYKRFCNEYDEAEEKA